MKSSFSLKASEIKKNIDAIQKLLTDKGVDACYVSSFDPFLNEYVPLEDCHRYYITGFNGSMAESLIPASGKVKLYVDGRYHEQADLQIDPELVEVVKCTKANTTELIDTIKISSIKKLACEGSRTTLEFYKKLDSICEVVTLNNEIESLLSKNIDKKYNPITLVSSEHRGEGTIVKLGKIFGETKDEAHYVTALDTIAWLTNCRGYHLPFLSSFLGRALVTHDKVHIFVEEEIEVEDSAKNEFGLNFIHCKASMIEYQLEQLQKRYQLSTVYYDSAMLNFADSKMLENVFSNSNLKSKAGGLVDFQAIKEPGEIKEFESSFDKASLAIFNTINWVKDNVKNKQKISELDLYNQTSTEYEKQGAITQSFNTISGVGANGSIIHYSDVKEDLFIKDEHLILLDSGGYFEGGFATDTTRTFMGSDKKVDAKYKEMYTLVLKGFVACHSAIFPDGFGSSVLDGLARLPMFKRGTNYAHGTGHGVGIHVHEGGAGISFRNNKMKAGQVVSIEPGYYVPGFGGVRIENVAVVEKHPKFDGYLYLRPLTKVGFEPCLIDESLLNDEEKVWLNDYEKICKELGTSFS